MFGHLEGGLAVDIEKMEGNDKKLQDWWWATKLGIMQPN